MKLKIVGTNTLLLMAKNLMDRGELNKEQYLEMIRRNNNLPESYREDIEIIKND